MENIGQIFDYFENNQPVHKTTRTVIVSSVSATRWPPFEAIFSLRQGYLFMDQDVDILIVSSLSLEAT